MHSGLKETLTGSFITAIRSLAIVMMLLIAVISCKDKVSHPAPAVSGEDLIVDISSIEDSVPRFFRFTVSGNVVTFFIVKNGERIESYLNACKKCYSYKMGYRLDGSHVVCNYCNVRYPIDSLRQGIGSCHPLVLPGKRRGTAYHIKLSDIEEAVKFF